jgi:hypothetical protein
MSNLDTPPLSETALVKRSTKAAIDIAKIYGMSDGAVKLMRNVIWNYMSDFGKEPNGN